MIREWLAIKTAVLGAIGLGILLTMVLALAQGEDIQSGLTAIHPISYIIIITIGLIYAEMIYQLDIFNLAQEHGPYEKSFRASCKIKAFALFVGVCCGITSTMILAGLYRFALFVEIPFDGITELMTAFAIGFPFVVLGLLAFATYVFINMGIKRLLFKSRRV